MESGKWKGKKRVPELRFLEFEGEWEERKLGELGGFKNGLNKSSDDFGHGTPMVNIMDVFNNTSINNDINFELVNATKNELKDYNLKSHDILFVRSSVKPTGVGLTSVIEEDLYNTTYGGFIIRFRITNKEFHLRFLEYVFLSNNMRRQIMSKATVSANTNVNQVSLEELKLLFPSLSEQQKIGDFFYKIDKKLELQQQRIEALKEYKKGMMQKIFSQEIRFKDDNGKDYPEWEEKRLGEVARIQGGYAFKSADYKQKGIPVIRISNISTDINLKGDIIYSDIVDISEKYHVKEGDLLIAMSGATTGKTGIYKNNKVAYLNQRVGKFLGSKYLYYDYLYHIVNSEIFKMQLKTRLIAGAQPNISPNDIEGFKIRLPIKEEQTKIANFLSSLDKKIELEEEKLENFKQFKKGLMQKMFI